ncbi:hypothetical protein METBIDRAFT_111983 [Metschnikowia bicuspidata var. bicuspidata NRRL YB-4993]|uniref:Uncharacterized protein n=1 Tax=Metschnikowia bicuspidata var. bicuspidata NRRL YB-4993 TaxID=869754 RepID=A0A1A0HIR8_9ASCO|nr:hypothetical protein METBIDRAFT_111983 [Metschnikowia bicuspidata var. bicuspidata NRRL YB-4993]OBA23733.1 hypothetical protein METBIDRAFT_111983 [Metschnikowia bicuspidata var. bicuspidata NRRL YB-4993]
MEPVAPGLCIFALFNLVYLPRTKTAFARRESNCVFFFYYWPRAVSLCLIQLWSSCFGGLQSATPIGARCPELEL